MCKKLTAEFSDASDYPSKPQAVISACALHSIGRKATTDDAANTLALGLGQYDRNCVLVIGTTMISLR